MYEILCCKRKSEIFTSQLTIEANHEAFQPQPIKTINQNEIITSQPLYNDYMTLDDLYETPCPSIYVNSSVNSNFQQINLKDTTTQIYAEVNSIGSSGISKKTKEKIFTKKPQPTPRTLMVSKKHSDKNNLNKNLTTEKSNQRIEKNFDEIEEEWVDEEEFEDEEIENEIPKITKPELVNESIDGNRIQQQWIQNINAGTIHSEVTLYNSNSNDEISMSKQNPFSIRLKFIANGLDREDVAKCLYNGDISTYGINLNQFDDYLKILDEFDIKESSGGIIYTYVGQNCVNGVCKISEIPEETAFVSIDNNLKKTNVYMVDNRIVKIDENLCDSTNDKQDRATNKIFESTIIKAKLAFYEDRNNYEPLDKLELEECRQDDRYIISFDELSIYQNFYYFHEAKPRKKLRKSLTTRELFNIASLNRYILFEASCLEAHNKFRSMHGVPPLQANDHLNIAAREWAERLALTGSFHHRPNNEFGENLYYGENMRMCVHGYTSVKLWYDEIKLYDYKNPRYIKGTTHFTQLIWRDTRELGTGIAIVGDKIWVCCNYYPTGNILEKFNNTYVPPLES